VLRLGARYRVVTGGSDGLLAALGVTPRADIQPPAATPALQPVADL